MPDHIHMIVILPDTPPEERSRKLGQVIGAYKSPVSTQWLHVCKNKGVIMGKLWQERYYDHIIRNDTDLDNTRSYIDTNPDRWMQKYAEEKKSWAVGERYSPALFFGNIGCFEEVLLFCRAKLQDDRKGRPDIYDFGSSKELRNLFTIRRFLRTTVSMFSDSLSIR